jgi:hypothetical protein
MLIGENKSRRLLVLGKVFFDLISLCALLSVERVCEVIFFPFGYAAVSVL